MRSVISATFFIPVDQGLSPYNFQCIIKEMWIDLILKIIDSLPPSSVSLHFLSDRYIFQRRYDFLNFFD